MLKACRPSKAIHKSSHGISGTSRQLSIRISVHGYVHTIRGTGQSNRELSACDITFQPQTIPAVPIISLPCGTSSDCRRASKVEREVRGKDIMYRGLQERQVRPKPRFVTFQQVMEAVLQRSRFRSARALFWGCEFSKTNSLNALPLQLALAIYTVGVSCQFQASRVDSTESDGMNWGFG